ncbi:hypothetical protein K469DRAFT_701847 [Zopfia rhizophila CBS 207.26]|uniref:Uncharacterized protein n=1 Tax=Zopfia rhizophila CBS 207.26 TaxID=1314779 RepID=A0A6A6EEH5_9PEZI|nr:hypothetical protein K469DRAFT_701847 [Zopfia rhizophila CBS 207.26]
MSDQSALLLLIQQLQQELQNQRTEIQSLQSLQSDVRHLQTQIQLLSASTAPRTRLPDPPRFDGKPFTLRTWLPLIRAKLRSDQLAGADAFDYPDVSCVTTLHRGLRPALYQSLEESSDSLFSLSYNDYIELPAQKPTQKTAHEPMDVDHLIRIASARVSFPRRPLNGLCFCCSSPDYWIDSCPYPVLPRQPRIKTTARSPTLDALLAARREEESNVTG